MEFHANCISHQTEDGVALLGFADDEFSPSQYIFLQRTLEPDQQNHESGHDAIHIEINSQERSTYGDVEQAQLERDRLSLRLSEDTASNLSSSTTIQITFDVMPDQLNNLAKQLRLLLGQDRVQTAH